MPADPTPLLHADALGVLRGWDAPDADQERLRQDYVDHLTAHHDGLLRTPQPDHLTASTLVLSADRSQVLLTLHRKARQWFQLGGHLEEGDDSLGAAALREATEESGIGDLEVSGAPVRLDLHPVPFCRPDGTARHLDVQYVALAPASSSAEISVESLDLRWWPVDALPTEEVSLTRLVARALAAT